MPTAKLTCSKDEPAQEIRTVKELDEWLDRLTERCNLEFPGIIRLNVHGYEIEIGLGMSESFVHLEHESGMPPYFTTLGDPQAEGDVPFYLVGDRHTVVPRRHLIPALLARQVIREFFETGCRPSGVSWEKET